MLTLVTSMNEEIESIIICINNDTLKKSDGPIILLGFVLIEGFIRSIGQII